MKKNQTFWIAKAIEKDGSSEVPRKSYIQDLISTYYISNKHNFKGWSYFQLCHTTLLSVRKQCGYISHRCLLNQVKTECCEGTLTISHVNKITLVQVPGHNEIEENVIADSLSRRASNQLFTHPKLAIKSGIKRRLKKKAQQNCEDFLSFSCLY